MKTAMWMVFVFALGVIGIVLINVFGNITTTNQQDYNLLKNTVEASMYDAIDIASYRAGFYLCTNDESTDTITFNSKNDYKIFLNSNINEENLLKEYKKCEKLVGEVKLNADVFAESFIRRFSSNVNNNKSYQITIKEVIEYPPKVSVRVDTYNSYNNNIEESTDFTTGDFSIRNQIDAIFEDKEIKE